VAGLPDQLVRLGERWRAAYALNPAQSRGRVHAEPDDPLRSPFQRDRDRIIHSNAFRRLKHKTQVFIHHDEDHFRTRLTHSLEVAQIARSIARPLGLDEDMAEALALAHDLGHPPFGHAGERAHDRMLAEFGGFDHNDQSLRVVTTLERRYPQFDGLNLTLETLDGLVKHNGPLLDPDGNLLREYSGGRLPQATSKLREEAGLDLASHAALEAQVAAIADDIAYDCHDLEDGLRARLIAADDLGPLSVVGAILRDIRIEHPTLDTARLTHELVRRLITAMIRDVLAETHARIMAAGVGSPEDVRSAGHTLAGFSQGMAAAESALKAFLLERVYRSDAVMRPAGRAEAIVADLFRAFTEDPGRMPADWRRGLGADPLETARRAGDYIAGMTDRYAVSEHRRLFDHTPDLG
jgi:dGTPase